MTLTFNKGTARLKLTVTMGSLHMVFHVAFLCEPNAAHFTLEGLFPSVFDHVNLQGALLVKGFVTLCALEGTFTCGKKKYIKLILLLYLDTNVKLFKANLLNI